MFGWLKKKSEPPASGERVAHQIPGAIFPWVKGLRLTALDEAMIAVPAAILGEGETIVAVIHCDDGVRINVPADPHAAMGDRITIWLQPGEPAWLSRSCQGGVVPRTPGDAAVRRFRLTEVGSEAEADRDRA